jgi:hypothetical protein
LSVAIELWSWVHIIHGSDELLSVLQAVQAAAEGSLVDERAEKCSAD